MARYPCAELRVRQMRAYRRRCSPVLWPKGSGPRRSCDWDRLAGSEKPHDEQHRAMGAGA